MTEGKSLDFNIRLYQPPDLPMLYKICLQTGDHGQDATGQLSDEILGHYYAAPYARYQPELCFTLLASGAPCGYIVGTSDSTGFSQFFNEEWLPPLLERYQLPDLELQTSEAAMVRQLHAGYMPPACTNIYPAHLHINILPIGQGQGNAKQMIDLFAEALRTLSASGLHLIVSSRNQRAIDFYRAYGFIEVDRNIYSIIFGLDLEQ